METGVGKFGRFIWEDVFERVFRVGFEGVVFVYTMFRRDFSGEVGFVERGVVVLIFLVLIVLVCFFLMFLDCWRDGVAVFLWSWLLIFTAFYFRLRFVCYRVV